MKFKLKQGKYISVFWTIIFGLALIFCVFTNNYLHKLSDNTLIESTTVVKTDKNKERNKKIAEYIASIDDGSISIVDVIDIKLSVTSILLLENEQYTSILFDYQTGKEISIFDLIKEGRESDFNNKIEELLYLKYPTFIADVLNNGDKNNVYFMKDNELIIYYYDYEITPAVKEDLYLTINYNEIKDYMSINLDLDSEYQNEDGKAINLAKKQIAITFDDGPGKYTKNLIDILENNKSNSTFFILGKNIKEYEDVLKESFTNGNEIGYHSYNHENFLRQDIEKIKEEFNKSNEELISAIGSGYTLIRPPYGSINNKIKESLDLPFILWNIDTEDWRYKNIDYLVDYVLDNVKENSIILFHDIHKTSVSAIEKLLPYLYVEGYQLVTISDLANVNGITLEAHKTYRYFS